MFRLVEQARQNNNNPMDLFKQVTSGYSTEQMDNLFNRARQLGVPDDVLKNIQNNGIKTQ